MEVPMENQLDLSAADRVLLLLKQLGIERAHFGGGIVEAEAHPEVVASIALLMPPGVARRVRALAERGSLAIPPLVVHGDNGPLAAWAPSVPSSPAATPFPVGVAGATDPEYADMAALFAAA
jgi:hypothetical protein